MSGRRRADRNWPWPLGRWVDRASRTTNRPWRSVTYLLPQILRVLVGGPETVRYPFGPAEVPEGFRGQVEIDADACRGCGLCVRDCPAFALELERFGRDAFRLIYHPDRCAYCGQCEASCRFGAIHQTHRFVRGTRELDALRVVLVDRVS